MPASPPTPAGSREREVRHRAARIEDWIHDVRERWARRRGHVPTIVPYTGYGSTEWVRVLCRVLLSRPIAADEPSKRRRKRSEQGIRGWRSFTSVPVGDVPVIIEVGGERIEVLADRGGVVDTRVPVALTPGWHQATLQVEGSEQVEAPIWIVGTDVHFGIISDVDDQHAGETAPASDALLASASPPLGRLVGRDRTAEQHAAEDARPLGRAVAGVRHDGRNVSASPRPALAEVVDPVFEARGTVPDLALSRSGRGWGTRRHPLSLSRGRDRPETRASRWSDGCRPGR